MYDIVIECQNKLVNDIYSQIPDNCKGKISKEDVRKSINKASERYANLMLFGTTDPKITFSIRYSDIIKQAKEEKSDENFVAKYIKFPKDEIFYFARELIKAAASAEKAEGDFFKMGRFFSKGGYR